MKRMGLCTAAALMLATAAIADGKTADTASSPKGEAVIGTVEATATVTKIDHKTREVTVRTESGEELSFVADEAIKNLPQVQVGDTIRAIYTEGLAYEVKKGGKAMGVEETVAGGTAKEGQKPAGAIGRKVTATVTVTAIDAKAPSITFKGPAGNERTVKVRHPEKLVGVAVGDAVDITYTQALAVKVEEVAKK